MLYKRKWERSDEVIWRSICCLYLNNAFLLKHGYHLFTLTLRSSCNIIFRSCVCDIAIGSATLTIFSKPAALFDTQAPWSNWIDYDYPGRPALPAERVFVEVDEHSSLYYIRELARIIKNILDKLDKFMSIHQDLT